MTEHGAGQNKVVFCRFVDQVMNQGDVAAVDELFAPDFIGKIAEHWAMPDQFALRQRLS